MPLLGGAVGPKEKPGAFFLRGTRGERRCKFCRGMEVMGKEDAESRTPRAPQRGGDSLRGARTKHKGI